MATTRPQFHTYVAKQVSDAIREHCQRTGMKTSQLVEHMWQIYSGEEPLRLVRVLEQLLEKQPLRSATLLVKLSELGRKADEHLAALRRGESNA